MKKKLLMFIMIGFFVVGVAAIWIVSIITTATYKIESQAYGGLVIDQELTSGNFNSLNDSAKFNDEFIFTNEGEGIYMNLNITTIKTSTDVQCVNWENDCNMQYTFSNDNPINTLELSEGKNLVNVSRGTNNVLVEVDCLQYSCPQDITPTISIEKIPV